jgi:hypothetical protein
MNRKGQNISEYAIIIGVIGSLLVIMSVYFQRSIQATIKSPVDNLGGFGSGWFSTQRVQEIGIEDNVNPIYGPRELSQSSYSTDNQQTVVTTEGGARVTNMARGSINIPEQTDVVFNENKYDQVTRPNVPEHQY